MPNTNPKYERPLTLSAQALTIAMRNVLQGLLTQYPQLKTPLVTDRNLELPDLSVTDVNEFIRWAEQLQLQPGVVHGDRRRAIGIELLRQGVNVLRGRIRTPADMKIHLKEYGI